MSVYLAGPMRGIPYYNFPAFDKAAEKLVSEGYAVVNPADMDRRNGFDAMKLPHDYDWNTIPEGFGFDDCVTRDIAAVRSCEAIYMLDGWQLSKGAQAEHALAVWLGRVVIYQSMPEQNEVRITNAQTGGQKGRKQARFDLIPVNPLWEVAELYGKGALKYADRNWELGYDWSLSFAALLRHAWQFWRGENRDGETGAHHLASVVFHALALIQFGQSHPELDDRPKS